VTNLSQLPKYRETLRYYPEIYLLKDILASLAIREFFTERHVASLAIKDLLTGLCSIR